MGLIAHFLRVLFRSHSRPINKRIARRGELIGSIIYVFSSAAAFTAIIYYSAHNPQDQKESPYSSGKAFTVYDSIRKFGMNKESTAIRIKGLKIEKEVIDRDDDKLIPVTT